MVYVDDEMKGLSEDNRELNKKLISATRDINKLNKEIKLLNKRLKWAAKRVISMCSESGSPCSIKELKCDKEYGRWILEYIGDEGEKW